jgi:hypothetical protein
VVYRLRDECGSELGPPALAVGQEYSEFHFGPVRQNLDVGAADRPRASAKLRHVRFLAICQVSSATPTVTGLASRIMEF